MGTKWLISILKSAFFDGVLRIQVVFNDTTEVLYKTTGYYAPAFERSILWNNETVTIDWPAIIQPILSAKDAQDKPFAESDVFE